MASLQSGKGGAPIGKPRMAADVPLVPTLKAVMEAPVVAPNRNVVATNARKPKSIPKPLDIHKN
jgi:hypothetical protein